MPRKTPTLIEVAAANDASGVHRPERLTVVAIGASVGGVEACRELFEALPADTGMAYVVLLDVPTVAPASLAAMLQKATQMPVLGIVDEHELAPDHVYFAAPGRLPLFESNRLNLAPLQRRKRVHAIDPFMRSLAQQPTLQAIGVLLSGTGSDGASGLQQIRNAGGIAFAQDQSAQHAAMPQSAINGGAVHFILPAARIATHLARIAKHPFVRRSSEGIDEPAFARILELLRRETAVDFKGYRRKVVERRVLRNMAVADIVPMGDFVHRLLASPSDIEALYQDVLANTASFFRDADALEFVKGEVFPELVGERNNNETIRAWVLGCSTGEEAYSLAIAFDEFRQASGRKVSLQVFATDLDGMALQRARFGVFSKAIQHDVSAERLSHYFTEVDGGYRIAKSIRDMCIFARHTAMSDPPFSRLDFLWCNVLDDFDPPQQDRVFQVLHYALRAGGLLWLGSSGATGAPERLFALQDGVHRIYNRRSGRTAPVEDGPLSAVSWDPVGRGNPRTREYDPIREADQLLLATYAPAAVVVDEDLNVLQFRGDTSAFLAPAPGRASLAVLRLLRDGLNVAARGAIARAKQTGTVVRAETVRVSTATGTRRVDLSVVPFRPGRGGGFVIVFQDAPEPVGTRRKRAPVEDTETLVNELQSTREYLQSVVQQYETAHDEAQSANEELQSLNEELESSKEEIESTSEELATMNEELQNRNTQLSETNADLSNLLSSVEMPIVILDWDLRIRRFTPAAGKLLNLLQSDVGRPISDIRLHLDVPDLDAVFASVLRSEGAYEREVQDAKGRWHSLRIRQYHATDNRVEGAIVMLVNIDSLKRAEQAVREADRIKDEYLAALAHELRNPLAALTNAAYLLTDSASRGESVQRAIGIVERQARTMVRIVDDLLDSSRLCGGGGLHLRREPINLLEAARHAVMASENERVRRRQVLATHYPDETIRVDADPVRIDQILTSVLADASRSSREEGSISLVLEREDSRGAAPPSALIRIRHDGLANAAGHLQKGTGLGLSLVRNLVDMHGGNLEIRSRAGVQELVVRLPLSVPGGEVELVTPDAPGISGAPSLRT